MVDDFAVGVEDGDDVGVGELAALVFFEFYAEEGAEFEDVFGFAAQEEPAIGVEFEFFAVGVESFYGVAFDVEGDENEADVGAEVLWKGGFDAADVVDEDRTGVFAGGEKHGDHLRFAAEAVEFHFLAEVRRPFGFDLVDGFVGDLARFDFVGGAAGRRREG